MDTPEPDPIQITLYKTTCYCYNDTLFQFQDRYRLCAFFVTTMIAKAGPRRRWVSGHHVNILISEVPEEFSSLLFHLFAISKELHRHTGEEVERGRSLIRIFQKCNRHIF